MSQVVAIVGRPNVGKSTLFNRLVGFRKAIVDEVAGVTRDRHYGICEWNGKSFTVIDTGGYVVGSEDSFEGEIRKQVSLAVEEADLILFMVDVAEGLTDDDKEVAGVLRKSKKKVLLVANKVDNNERQSWSAEFYALGLGDPMNIAATSGAGTGELLDFIASHVENEPEENIENELPHLAIVGRPNVGKSSLLNALTGEERNIVTPIAGTTRDTIHKRYNQFGFDFVLVDTAGIRKKTKVKEDLEFYSVMRSIRAIEDCDVVMLMIDASLGFDSQDRHIFHLAQKNHKGIVILVNKWDLLEKDNHTVKQYEQTIRKEIEPFTDVPIVFISALTKQRIHKALETALQVHESRRRKIPARQLNDELLPLIENQPPPAWKGKYVRIKFITQLPTRTPQFAFFCNLPQYVREPYKRFLENQIRERWDFSGVPLEIYMRKK
jgi:GTP-binding protein